jgi:hypothetical protein
MNRKGEEGVQRIHETTLYPFLCGEFLILNFTRAIQLTLYYDKKQ